MDSSLLVPSGHVVRDLISVAQDLPRWQELGGAQLYFYLCANIRALNKIASGQARASFLTMEFYCFANVSKFGGNFCWSGRGSRRATRQRGKGKPGA